MRHSLPGDKFDIARVVSKDARLHAGEGNVKTADRYAAAKQVLVSLPDPSEEIHGLLVTNPHGRSSHAHCGKTVSGGGQASATTTAEKYCEDLKLVTFQ
jgi:hypothetical protein